MPAKKVKAARGPRLIVKRSGIHGKGVFARRAIRKGARLTEYWGPAITWEEAERRYPKDPVPYHTFLFEIGDGSMCIDAQDTRSVAKWINHACRPNCVMVNPLNNNNNILVLVTTEEVQPGQELFVAYMDVDTCWLSREQRRKELFAEHGFECNCADCADCMNCPST